MIHILRDLPNAVRTLRKSPGYTAACVIILALGIGANAAIFSVLDAEILHAVPYPEADRLVAVWSQIPNMPEPFGQRMTVGRLTFEAWQQQNKVFSGMAAIREGRPSETSGAHPQKILAAYVSPNLFPMLGAKAVAGRLFRSDEDHAGSVPVAVLSWAYFEKRFAADPSKVGASIKLDGQSYTILGVLPRTFYLPDFNRGMFTITPDVYVPLARSWSKTDNPEQNPLTVVAKLRPRVTVTQARLEIVALTKQLFAQDEKRYPLEMTSVFSLTEEGEAADLRESLSLLLGASGLLLFIGCANLANLTLARATLRQREIAIRRALGASRARLISQLLSESFVVSALGAVVGLWLAGWLLQGLAALQIEDIRRPELIHLNLSLFGFAAAVSVITALLFGLAPAIFASRASVNAALKSNGGGGASASRAWSRQLLIAAQVGMALVLLTGSGLMIRSFQKVAEKGLGFRTEQLITMDVELSADRYKAGPSRSQFYRQLLAKVRSIPGVAKAAVTTALPLHSITAMSFEMEGKPAQDKTKPVADIAFVSPDYLQVLGIPMEAGRPLQSSDSEGVKNIPLVVNAAFARKFFPDQKAVGQHLKFKGALSEIVGVAANYNVMGADEELRPQFFFPQLDDATNATLVVKTVLAPEIFSTPLRNAVWSVDATLPIPRVETMTFYVRRWLSERRFYTLLLSIFAGLALLLAMTGVYSVLANLVTARTREIGIRMTLGATPSGIARMVAAQSLRPLGVGLAIGLAGSLAIGTMLDSVLFEVSPRDPLTLALALTSILLVAPLAILIPLRRATKVECTVALREE